MVTPKWNSAFLKLALWRERERERERAQLSEYTFEMEMSWSMDTQDTVAQLMSNKGSTKAERLSTSWPPWLSISKSFIILDTGGDVRPG